MPVFQVNVVQLIYLCTDTGVFEQVHLRLQTAQGVGERYCVFPVFTGKARAASSVVQSVIIVQLKGFTPHGQGIHGGN